MNFRSLVALWMAFILVIILFPISQENMPKTSIGTSSKSGTFVTLPVLRHQ